MERHSYFHVGVLVITIKPRDNHTYTEKCWSARRECEAACSLFTRLLGHNDTLSLGVRLVKHSNSTIRTRGLATSSTSKETNDSATTSSRNQYQNQNAQTPSYISNPVGKLITHPYNPEIPPTSSPYTPKSVSDTNRLRTPQFVITNKLKAA
jgi:hypothetical protein